MLTKLIHQDYTVAIAVPEQIYLMDFCKKKNIEGTFEQLCKSQVLNKNIYNKLFSNTI